MMITLYYVGNVWSLNEGNTSSPTELELVSIDYELMERVNRLKQGKSVSEFFSFLFDGYETATEKIGFQLTKINILEEISRSFLIRTRLLSQDKTLGSFKR